MLLFFKGVAPGGSNTLQCVVTHPTTQTGLNS